MSVLIPARMIAPTTIVEAIILGGSEVVLVAIDGVRSIVAWTRPAREAGQQLFWGLAFLADREASVPGPTHLSIGSIALVVLLAIVSHVWLSGSWMEQAGLRADRSTHGSIAVWPCLTDPSTATCFGGAR